MTEIKEAPLASAVVESARRTKPIRARSTAGLLIDAHVHCHTCFDPAKFLDHAASNFDQARVDLILANAYSDRAESSAGKFAPGCLLLAENPTDDFFDALRTAGELRPLGRHKCEPSWRVEATSESCSLICRRGCSWGDDVPIIVIAGRQLVVREGLEVLALCSDRHFPIGRSLKSTLEEVIRAGAIPVMPWGFGKWWFTRGTLVRKVLESGFSSCVFLGDNGNRLHAASDPWLFQLAAARGVRVLPGSDPLPLPDRARAVGSFGFFLEGEVDLDRPAAWIKNELRRQVMQPRPFGRRESFLRFCVSQIAMQLRRHLNKF